MALGDIYEADRLIEVTSVHVSGASYKIIGEAGLEFLEEFSRTARAKVRTTANPLGMDLGAWREIGIPEEFASKQVRIVEAYQRMGVEETWSCIPYQVGNRPEVGEHLAWAESSAVIFANSILGARTNREGGPSALASAITGWTPNYGLHLEENRRATARVEVTTPVKGYEYSLLGHHLGKRLGSGVPLIEGLKGSEDELKALGASMATSSDINMFHIEGLTPEWEMVDSDGLKRYRIDKLDLDEAKEELLSSQGYDMIAFGCPQLSAAELREVADLMELHEPKVPVWAFTSRKIAEEAMETVKRIRQLGGRVILDTCPEVMPLDLVALNVGTASAKAAIYLPRLSGQRVFVDSHEELMRRKR